jgi:hypothetical protein
VLSVIVCPGAIVTAHLPYTGAIWVLIDNVVMRALLLENLGHTPALVPGGGDGGGGGELCTVNVYTTVPPQLVPEVRS